ncbi:MAG: sigma-70 family RNA polymerase sigma factor [Pseudomonadota bacterium]
MTEATASFPKSPSRSEVGGSAADTKQVTAKEPWLSELYRAHSDELRAYLTRQFGNGPPDPDDMVQQAFQKLLERGDHKSIKNLRAFLWRTARNLTLNSKRNNQNRSQYDFEIEHLYFANKGNGSSPARVLEVKEQLRIISETLINMPEKRRTAFVLHRIDGLTVSAIARRYGNTHAAIIKHIARAASDIDGALEAYASERET